MPSLAMVSQLLQTLMGRVKPCADVSDPAVLISQENLQLAWQGLMAPSRQKAPSGLQLLEGPWSGTTGSSSQKHSHEAYDD